MTETFGAFQAAIGCPAFLANGFPVAHPEKVIAKAAATIANVEILFTVISSREGYVFVVSAARSIAFDRIRRSFRFREKKCAFFPVKLITRPSVRKSGVFLFTFFLPHEFDSR